MVSIKLQIISVSIAFCLMFTKSINAKALTAPGKLGPLPQKTIDDFLLRATK